MFLSNSNTCIYSELLSVASWKVNPHAADCRVKRGALLKREHSDWMLNANECDANHCINAGNVCTSCSGIGQCAETKMHKTNFR